MLPDLPPEIYDQVFEYAARMHPKYAPTLTVVSKRVQKCVEKVIYEKLHLVELKSDLIWSRSAEVAMIQLFKFTLHQRPAEFFATHVRSVYFQENVKYDSARPVLQKCTALEHLAFFLEPYPFSPSDLFPSIFFSPHTLQSLMTNKNVLRHLANSGIIFPRLRYLWIGLRWDVRVPALDWLPALQTVDLVMHKAPWSGYAWKEDAKTVMDSTKGLQVLGLCVYDDDLGYVHRWRETIVSHIMIKIRTRSLSRDDVLERWRALATNITDVLLE